MSPRKPIANDHKWVAMRQQAPKKRGTAYEKRAGREWRMGAAMWPQPTGHTYEKRREPELAMACGGGNEFDGSPLVRSRRASG